jgi:hypothetical protein
MSIKKVRAIKGTKAFKAALKQLVTKHGKVQIIFAEGYSAESLRRRIIMKDGSCIVSYKGRGYKKWSRYDDSCFMDYYHSDNSWEVTGSKVKRMGKKKTLLNTIEAMCEHDKFDGLHALQISYGPKFRQKIAVLKEFKE